MTGADPRRVEATPEKRFFISMLVKDIELIPAILDLVDNCVDGAKRVRPEADDARFAGLHVRITVSADTFRIEDNCGGIEVEHALIDVFWFGRKAGLHGPEGEVGQFGIGMKRALFKLGDAFWIESKSATSSFILPVDVGDWAEDRGPDWSFEFEEVAEGIEGPGGRARHNDPDHVAASACRRRAGTRADVCTFPADQLGGCATSGRSSSAWKSPQRRAP